MGKRRVARSTAFPTPRSLRHSPRRLPGAHPAEHDRSSGVEAEVGSPLRPVLATEFVPAFVIAEQARAKMACRVCGCHAATLLPFEDVTDLWPVRNTPRSNGSTASTIAGCWSPSATSRLPKPKINIMLPWTTSIWQR